MAQRSIQTKHWDTVVVGQFGLVGDGGKSRDTPAMEAGLSDHVWSVEELVGLLQGND